MHTTMRRNRSLPPNKQPRATMSVAGSKSRSASMAPPPDCRPMMMRDVKSKAVMSRAVTSLVEFLDSSDYPNDISTRILQSPNAKEVFCIFEHLVRQVDPLFRLERPGLKVEELCASTLRALGYPYTLSKQYLATPGAPHAWPYVLAALDWLRQEVVELNERMDTCYMFKYDDEQDKEQEPLGKLLYEIALSEYHAQIQGEQLDHAVVENFRRRMLDIHGCVDQEKLRQLEAHARELEAELTTVGDLDARIDALHAQCASLDATIEREHNAQTLIESQIEHISPELLKHTEEKAKLESEKNELQKKLTIIRKKLEDQEASGHARLAEEKLMLTERYNARLKAKTEVVRETEQLQLEFSRREGKIAPALDAFNRLISSIRAPGFQQIAKECDLQIRTYQAGFNITTDLPAVAQAAQKNMECFRSAVLTAEQHVNSLIQAGMDTKDMIDKMDLAGIRTQIAELQEQVDKLNELLQIEVATSESLEREMMEKRQALSAQAEQLHAEASAVEDKGTELKAMVEKENKVRLNSMDFLEEVDSKMKVLLPQLQGMLELKGLCQQTWQARVTAMRAQLRRASNRMQSKVQDALRELNELSGDSALI